MSHMRESPIGAIISYSKESPIGEISSSSEDSSLGGVQFSTLIIYHHVKMKTLYLYLLSFPTKASNLLFMSVWHLVETKILNLH